MVGPTGAPLSEHQLALRNSATSAPPVPSLRTKFDDVGTQEDDRERTPREPQAKSRKPSMRVDEE